MTNAKVMLDTNVLAYAFTAAAPFHNEARAALRRLEAQKLELWISRQIIREYVATLTRPQTYAVSPKFEEIAQQVNAFLVNFAVADDTARVTTTLFDLLKQFPTGGKQVHDANIVATMLVYGIETLLTHNVADFKRFDSQIVIAPLVEVEV